MKTLSYLPLIRVPKSVLLAIHQETDCQPFSLRVGGVYFYLSIIHRHNVFNAVLKSAFQYRLFLPIISDNSKNIETGNQLLRLTWVDWFYHKKQIWGRILSST